MRMSNIKTSDISNIKPSFNVTTIKISSFNTIALVPLDMRKLMERGVRDTMVVKYTIMMSDTDYKLIKTCM